MSEAEILASGAVEDLNDGAEVAVDPAPAAEGNESGEQAANTEACPSEVAVS